VCVWAQMSKKSHVVSLPLNVCVECAGVHQVGVGRLTVVVYFRRREFCVSCMECTCIIG